MLCVDAGKAGAGREAASSSRMSLDEAYRILGIERQSPIEEVLKVIYLAAFVTYAYLIEHPASKVF